MSKKSQKKSSKSTSGSRAVHGTARTTRAQPKAEPAKARGTANRKAGKSAAKSAFQKPASHKAASKRLKSSESTPVPNTDGKAALAEGQKAPAFRLPRDGGGIATSSDYAGRKLVLFFYPRADTPGCTREAIDFTRLSEAFAASDTTVIGISADPPKAQERFRDKHRLAVPLISDEQHEMLQAYGAWGEKSMYGRKFLGIFRTTVLVGKDGRIARIWRNVRVDGHAEEVLTAARGL